MNATWVALLVLLMVMAVTSALYGAAAWLICMAVGFVLIVIQSVIVVRQRYGPGWWRK